MDLENIMLKQVNQTDKHKCHMILLIHGINKTNDYANKKQNQTHKHREQTDGGQRGRWEDTQNG